MNSRNIYIVLAVVFVCSLVAAVWFHYLSIDAVAGLAAIPVLGSLFGALFQVSRDAINFERSLIMEDAKNRFTIGATSHMANTAFDKHVQFAEEYVAKMYVALACLFQKGPTAEVLPFAIELVEIRRKWSLWVTTEIENELQSYERALFTIANNERMVSKYPELDFRQKLISEMFQLLVEVIGEKQWEGKPTQGDIATQKIIDSLRRVLGISVLTQLRAELVKQASKEIKSSNVGAAS
jgi:hypothetical protein